MSSFTISSVMAGIRAWVVGSLFLQSFWDNIVYCLASESTETWDIVAAKDME